MVNVLSCRSSKQYVGLEAWVIHMSQARWRLEREGVVSCECCC